MDWLPDNGRFFGWFLRIRELENLPSNTKMEISTEKQLPVSNKSCNFFSKAVKRVDKFQQTCQPETFNN